MYTKVAEDKPAHLSEGWTVVLMDRADRFIWELQYGERDADLFKRAMTSWAQVVDQTDDLSLFTDGDRRYGNLLNDDIHANHLEAFNSVLRRRMACYRRRTNTYAKEQPALQIRLDAYWGVT